MKQDVSRYWLALKFVPRLSIQKKLALVEEYGLSGVFALSKQQLLHCGLTNKQADVISSPQWDKIDYIIHRCQSLCQLVTFTDECYPEQLKQINDPPLILFCQGNIELLQKDQIAIVGSRNVSYYGKDTTQTFTHQLTQRGLVVTSGLALGVDAISHKAALTIPNSTIAVVATGLDIVYPKRNQILSRQIINSGGLIVSEFLPGTTAKPGHFPRRNRIISGLSLGVLVIEATIKSGSLITARCAIEQNREVFAVPGSIFNKQSAGCHWLIKQGAKLTESVDDITDELADCYHQSGKTNDTKKDEKNCIEGLLNDPLLASVGYETTAIDLVASRNKLPVERVISQLTILELQGLVKAVPGGYLRLK